MSAVFDSGRQSTPSDNTKKERHTHLRGSRICHKPQLRQPTEAAIPIRDCVPSRFLCASDPYAIRCCLTERTTAFRPANVASNGHRSSLASGFCSSASDSSERGKGLRAHLNPFRGRKRGRVAQGIAAGAQGQCRSRFSLRARRRRSSIGKRP